MTRHRTGATVGALAAATLLIGCAHSVTGQAAPVADPPTVSDTATGTDRSTGVPTSAPDTSTPGTSTPDTSRRITEPTDTSTAPTTSGPTESSGVGPTTGGPTTSGQGGGGDQSQYPTAPLTLDEHPSSEQSGALLEARRLSDHVIDAAQVDPRFSSGGGLSTLPLRGPEALSSIMLDPVPTVAKRGGMYTGFVGSRSDPKSDASLLIAAFVYPDPAAAKKGAADLAAAAKGDGDKVTKIPRRPNADGITGQTGDSANGEAYEAVGSVVAYVWTNGPKAQRKTLPQLMGTALSQQVAALKGYQPTPKDQLMSLPVDPDGVYARTLPVPPEASYVFNGSWPAAGALHYQTTWPRSQELFAATGVDVVAIGRSTVYRTTDAGAARDIVDSFYEEVKGDNENMSDYQPGTDAGDPRCLADTLSVRYYCVGSVDRYAFEYHADSEQDMTRSLESQVAMLTG